MLAIAEGTVEAWRIPEGYEQTRKAWLEQIELNPRNTVVLAHAAQAFVHGDLSPAIELIRRARLLYGSKPAWAKQLRLRDTVSFRLAGDSSL